MKKINLLFKLFIIGIIILLYCLVILISQGIEPTITSESKEEPPIVYDTELDWTSKVNNSLQPVTLDRKIEGRFIDTDTAGCFFLAMKMLNYEVDIDKFYLDFFNEVESSPETVPKEGKISPELLYQYSLVCIKANDYNISVEDIGDKGIEYILQAATNNYPIIVWLNDKNWILADPYVIYKVDLDSVYLTNLNSRMFMSKEDFMQSWLDNESSHAIIYGKYW